MINKTFVPDHLPVESNAAKITLPFYHPITTAWDLADLDPAKSNDAPNLNLTVAGLILSSNIELSVGRHAWSLAEETLDQMGFTDIKHHNFELAERINHPALVPQSRDQCCRRAQGLSEFRRPHQREHDPVYHRSQLRRVERLSCRDPQHGSRRERLDLLLFLCYAQL